jgi:HPr kinase/phosphorylase
MNSPHSPTIHGTAIAFGTSGVLLRGPPGSGKSSLALRLIDQPGHGIGNKLMRAKLVADDQVVLEQFGDRVVMAAPYVLRNQIEIRGLGIRRLTALTSAQLDLVVDLVTVAEIPRMPTHEELICVILGVRVKRMAVDAGEPAAVSRIRAALFHTVAKSVSEA